MNEIRANRGKYLNTMNYLANCEHGDLEKIYCSNYIKIILSLMIFRL